MLSCVCDTAVNGRRARSDITRGHHKGTLVSAKVHDDTMSISTSANPA